MADKILENLQASYRDRVERLVNKLKSEPRIEIVCRPLGGYFLWIKLPEGVISENFLSFCRDKVTFMPGVRCDPTNNEDDKRIYESHARLCFADLSVEHLEQGADELVLCLRKYMEEIESRN
jgi:DNA-binding transcriptional MocR family regulator